MARKKSFPPAARSLSTRGMLLCTVLLGALAGCDCEGGPQGGPCGDSPPLDGCGQACGSASPCPTGLFCAVGQCTAECGHGHGCTGGRVCSAQGRCVTTETDAGPMMNEDAPFVMVDAYLGDVPAPDNTCASVMLDATRVIPNVLLVVDRSGSMEMNEFSPGVSRWDALQGALFDPATGLVTGLESSVRFGIAMYSNDTRTMACPDLFTVPCSINNAESIEAEYTLRTPPRGDTPTGESISAVLGMIDTLVPERGATSPTFFVLATDGEPDLCADGTALDEGRAASVAATTEAFGMGINTYVVSVGAEVSEAHLQDVANAGVGMTAAPFYVATDTAGLVSALRTIIRGVASCDVRLEGMVESSMACEGTVRLGPDALECGTDWMLLDDGRTIRLLGAACDRLQTSGETLTAAFPCEAILG
ncbi:MAG: vWA domain-containing protein [Sandaracinus sp.]